NLRPARAGRRRLRAHRQPPERRGLRRVVRDRTGHDPGLRRRCGRVQGRRRAVDFVPSQHRLLSRLRLSAETRGARAWAGSGSGARGEMLVSLTRRSRNTCAGTRYRGRVTTTLCIALVTTASHPELDDESQPLADALRMRGARPKIVHWDDPAVDWEEFDLAVILAAWDHTDRIEDFLAWAKRVPRLVNPPNVLRW